MTAASAPRLALATLAVALEGCASASGIGEPAPPFSAIDTHTSERIDLADYRGRAVIVNVWATWCGPCLREMPALSSVQRRYGDELVVLFISDETNTVLRAFVAEKGYTGTFARVNAATLEGPFTAARFQRPVSVLIGRDGRVLDQAVGDQSASFFARWAEIALATPPN